MSGVRPCRRSSSRTPSSAERRPEGRSRPRGAPLPLRSLSRPDGGSDGRLLRRRPEGSPGSIVPCRPPREAAACPGGVDMANSINGWPRVPIEARPERDDCPLPGCCDGLSALISEDAGFEAIFLSGTASRQLPGNPDIGLTTFSETAQRRATSWTPARPGRRGRRRWLAAQRGERSARLYEVESAGVAAIQMEDPISPTALRARRRHERCSRWSSTSASSAAALKARQTPLCIIARTDSTDLDDAILRARKYLERGPTP